MSDASLDVIGHSRVGTQLPDADHVPTSDGHSNAETLWRPAVDSKSAHGSLETHLQRGALATSSEFDGHRTGATHNHLAVDSEAGQESAETHRAFAGPATSPEFDGHCTSAHHPQAAVDSEAGPECLEAHDAIAGLATSPEFDGQTKRGTQKCSAVDSEAGQPIVEPRSDGAGLDTTIIEIREQWRRRQAWHRAEKSLTLQAKALCRRLAEDGDKVEADIIYRAALGKGEHPMAEIALAAMMPLTDARDSVEKHRKLVEKQLAKLAKSLPVAPWVGGVRGVGIASLAAIVGECGDLSNYSNPGKLWKRLGLAPYNGKAASTWRRQGGLKAAEWELLGYSPARCSVVWNVGACIVKAGGPLKALYDERKAYELPRVETKMHAHNRAQRYVEKRFVLLLWQQWRGGGHSPVDIQKARAPASLITVEQ